MTEVADRPDLRIVGDEEAEASAPLATSTPAVTSATRQPMSTPATMSFIKTFALEAAMGAASGAVVGYLAAPKQKRGRAVGIGALAGMGLQVAMRGVTLSAVLPPERRTPFRILTIGAGAGAVIGAGYLVFGKKSA